MGRRTVVMVISLKRRAAPDDKVQAQKGQVVPVRAQRLSRGGWMHGTPANGRKPLARVRCQEKEGGPRAGGGVASTGVKLPVICTAAE